MSFREELARKSHNFLKLCQFPQNFVNFYWWVSPQKEDQFFIFFRNFYMPSATWPSFKAFTITDPK